MFVDWSFQLVIEIFETLGFDVGQGLLRRAIENQFAAHQHDNLVEQLDVFHRVRGEHDGAAALGDLAEELHDLLFGGRIET